MKFFCNFALALVCVASLTQNAVAANTDSPDSSRLETWIIRFHEAGLLYYQGGVKQMTASAPTASGARKLDAKSSAAITYTQYLRDLQSARLEDIQTLLQRRVPMVHTYTVTMNGVAIEVNQSEAARLRTLPEIISVEKEGTYYLHTDAGPTFIGAPGIWNGANVPATSTATRGQDIVVGIIDSGTNSDHPSFANFASCGYSVSKPKLISAKDCYQANCIGGQPEDISTTSSGHGIHVASIAAGNVLTPPLVVEGASLLFPISGVAPCARVRSYKACENSCPGSALLAAIEQAIIDNVDIVNYSISGGTSPWNDLDRGFLDMVNADILVFASAGNTRTSIPDPVAEVNHRGPWVMTVANSTHDRVIAYDVDVAGGPQNGGATPGSGMGFPNGATTAGVASAALLGNVTGCTASGGFAANSMTGKIALISRGVCPFSEKIDNATTAGAVAAIIYNSTPGPAISMGGLSGTTIPSAMLPRDQGVVIQDFIAINPSAMMTVTGPVDRVINSAFGDILAPSSLRGPNLSFDVTKPDITGPGTRIYAAMSDLFGQFGYLTGTSMSSPHLAGAGALIRAAHPTWTPMEVKSAMQLTAIRDGLSDDAATPWTVEEVGNGRIDLTRAALAGMVMDESFANFVAANPDINGQPGELNLPSLRNSNCLDRCTFTRTFRNTVPTPVTWNAVTTDVPPGTQIDVTPPGFSFTGDTGETQTVSITVTITESTAQGVPASLGQLIFRDAALTLPDARLSVAINGTILVTLFKDSFEGPPLVHPSTGTSSTLIACGATTTYYDPGGTGDYGNSQTGTLTLDPSTVGKMVEIDFTAGPFDIEPDGNACFDFITIHDGTGTGDPVIGTYCNSNIPAVITSTTGSLTVLFASDTFETGSGWVADVRCVDP